MGAQRLLVRLAQVEVRLGDLDWNLQRHLEIIGRAATDGVDLLVFPELSLTGYYLRDLAYEVAVAADGPVMGRLAEAAGGMTVVVGFVEEDRRHRLFSSAAVLQGGKVAFVHRKVYLPTYGMFDEARYLTAGDRVRVFEWDGVGRVGIMICEDAWHPSVPLILSRQGADLMVATAASPAEGLWPGRMAVQAAWEDMLATYARLFQCIVLFCNRAGCEDGFAFWGGSGAWGPDGREICRAPLLQAAEVDCEIDLRDVRQARVSASLVADERDELTLRELERIGHEGAGD